MPQTLSLMICNSVKRFNYIVFTVLPCVSYSLLRGPLPAAQRCEEPCNFQFLEFSQGFMASLSDVMGHYHGTGAFEEVGWDPLSWRDWISGYINGFSFVGGWICPARCF